MVVRNLTDVDTDVDSIFDELLDAEIPCMGITNPGIERSCSHRAALRTSSHGHGFYFKCIECWQIWYVFVLGIIADDGCVRCSYCHHSFTTVELFSDYRSF